MKVKQTKEELKDQLDQQLQFLKNSFTLYDNGSFVEAKRIASTVRLLIHQTEKSSSLISLITEDSLVFEDISFDYNEANRTTFNGCVMQTISITGATFMPYLNNGPSAIYNKTLPFDDWWNKIVIRDNKQNFFTRKDLILNMANTDGGAHVDPKINERYYHLTRTNSSNWEYFIDNNPENFKNQPYLATIRHIGFEVESTIKKNFNL